jgi:hypothetical protein
MFFNFLRGSEVLRGLNMMPVIYLNSSEGVSACKMFLFTPAPAAGPPLTVTSALFKLNLARLSFNLQPYSYHSVALASIWFILAMQLHFGSRKALVHACRASSIINPRPSPRSWRMLPPPALMFITFVSILVFLPWSVALPSVFFNLESIDIQPMDDQGSLLRVCAEYHASNVTLAQGIAAVKLHFSPDGPSATSYAPSDALCVHGVERGGRYRAQIMLIDDRDGSELNVQSPPPGASSENFLFFIHFSTSNLPLPPALLFISFCRHV